MKRLIFGQLLFLLSTAALAQDIRATITSVMESFSPESCMRDAQRVQETFKSLKHQDYLKEFSQKTFPALSQELWDFKLSLHKKMRSFYQQGQLNLECARSLRGAFRSLRLTEDFIEESYSRHAKGMSFPTSAFIENNPHVHKAHGLENFQLKSDLQSGDLILTRGNAFTSAAIASLGEEDTQFSHLSIVHKDDQGKFWTVEAHIEVGSIVRHLEDHIKDSNFRTMIFRFDDEALAAKAAKYAYDHVKMLPSPLAILIMISASI